MKVDNIIISATAEQILFKLKTELELTEILRFKTIKDASRNIQTNCPFHKGGNEKKPSFGIQKENGDCHCFTCGWSGNIFNLISNLFEINDSGEFGKKWCLRHFNSTVIEQRIVQVTQPRRQIEKKAIQFVTEQELEKYRVYHNYMYQRGLTNRIIEKFDVGYDNDTNCLTFPVNDQDGNCLFVARRSVATKFFSYPDNAEKPVYALDECLKINAKKVMVVESILNCLTAWKFGVPCIALNGLGSAEQIEIINRCNIRHLVLALDPDERGQKAQERLTKKLTGKIITRLVYTDNSKDINDLQADFLKLSSVY